jgi:hypothetical protein
MNGKQPKRHPATPEASTPLLYLRPDIPVIVLMLVFYLSFIFLSRLSKPYQFPCDCPYVRSKVGSVRHGKWRHSAQEV